jgi:hypothetical protein
MIAFSYFSFASFVRTMFSKAFLWAGTVNSEDTVREITIKEMRKLPQMHAIMATTRPNNVRGTKSPYPTVAIVIMTHHIEFHKYVQS